MDPFSIGAGAVGAVGGVLSSIFSRNASKAQIRAQQVENEKNRVFNAEQASLARQYNIAMVNSQNAYNSPMAMMSRLRSAGLNPNLVYGELGAGTSLGVGSTSMAASSSGSVGTSLPDYSGVAGAAREAAEIGLINAQKDKLNSERELTEKEIHYFDATKSREFAIADMQVTLGESNKNMTDEQRKLLAKQCAKTDEELTKVREDIALVAAQRSESVARALGYLLDNKLKSATFDSAVKQLAASASFTEQQANMYARIVCSSLTLQAAQANLSNAQASKALGELQVLVDTYNKEYGADGTFELNKALLKQNIGEASSRWSNNIAQGRLLRLQVRDEEHFQKELDKCGGLGRAFYETIRVLGPATGPVANAIIGMNPLIK